MNKCKNCGGKLDNQPGKVGRKPKYCCRKCASEYRYKYPEEVKETRREANCSFCGKPFLPYNSKHEYCSRECYAQTIRTLIGAVCKCGICGAEYEPGCKEQKCCSKECQFVASNKAIVEGLSGETKFCKTCNNKFTPIRINQEYCSKSCKGKGFYSNNLDYFLNRRNIRRTKPFGVDGQEVSIEEIYDKSNGICGICGKRVDKKLKFPHPLSLSIDHIIPISRGGAHTSDNVQVAHIGCNSKKGNRKIITNNKGQLMNV